MKVATKGGVFLSYRLPANLGPYGSTWMDQPIFSATVMLTYNSISSGSSAGFSRILDLTESARCGGVLSAGIPRGSLPGPMVTSGVTAAVDYTM